MTPAPIILFVYKRLDTLIQCINSLKANPLSVVSELHIYSDGAAKKEDIAKVKAVRSYLPAIVGFKKIEIINEEKNKGLANSIISGVASVLFKKGRAIVLEDDLVVSKNFLSFMNKALDFYENEKRVASISGFTLPIKVPENYTFDVYLTKRSFSWGWATWQNRWEKVDWEVHDYKTFLADKKSQRDFNIMGTDLSSMLKKQMDGKLNSWAIRWCYHQFRNDLFNIFPINSKVLNDGFNVDATHSNLNNTRYKTLIIRENQNDFKFLEKIELNTQIIKQFTYYFSIQQRLYYKVLDKLGKVNNIFK